MKGNQLIVYNYRRECYFIYGGVFSFLNRLFDRRCEVGIFDILNKSYKSKKKSFPISMNTQENYANKWALDPEYYALLSPKVREYKLKRREDGR